MNVATITRRRTELTGPLGNLAKMALSSTVRHRHGTDQGADGVDGLAGRDLARGQVEGGGRQVREVIELRARTLLTLDSLLR